MNQEKNDMPGTTSAMRAVGAQGGTDGFLSSLSEFQSKIDAIKAMHEQTSAREVALTERERMIAEREAGMAARLAEVERRQGEIAEGQAALAAAHAAQDAAFREARTEAARLAELGAAQARAADERSAEFERSRRKQLDALEAARAETARRESDVAEREGAVAARMVRAEAEMARAAREQEGAESTRREASAERRATEVREQALLQRDKAQREIAERTERDAAAAVEAIEARREEVRTQAEELHEREFDLKTQIDELARERAGVAEHARALAAQMKSADDEHNAAIWANRMESMQLEIGEAKASRVRTETELAQARADIEAMTQELIDANAHKGVAPGEVERRDRTIADLSGRLEEARATTHMLQERMETLDRAAQALGAERASEAAMRDEHARTMAETLATRTGECEALRETATRAEVRAAELEASLLEARESTMPRTEHDKVAEELAAARELLDQAEATARGAVPASELRASEDRVTELEAALESARADAAELETRRNAESEEVAAGVPDAAEMDALRAESASLRARLESAERTLAHAVSPTLLEERNQTIADLQNRLEDAQSRTAGVNEKSDEILRRDEAIRLLHERLEQALAERETLCRRLESGSASERGPSEGDFRRRDRLRRYKTMLQGQARKIIAAQTAIQRRHADCELVLQNRAKLSELAHKLSRAEKKISSGKARTGAAAAVLYLAATVGVLAVLSWESARRVWPGTYVARAVVDADMGRRAAKPEELAAWSTDHQDMFGDPRLMELAAERMQRRGLSALGTPAELGAYVKQNMYVQNGKPGSLTVELRGEGAEKTALVLDTLVTSFKAFADQARDERSNDIGVVIAQAATAGGEPLLDKRLERAGGVFGGAALAAGLAGMVVWSRLVRAKRKFDQASAVEAALEEVDWSTLEASIKKHAPKASA